MADSACPVCGDWVHVHDGVIYCERGHETKTERSQARPPMQRVKQEAKKIRIKLKRNAK